MSLSCEWLMASARLVSKLHCSRIEMEDHILSLIMSIVFLTMDMMIHNT